MTSLEPYVEKLLNQRYYKNSEDWHGLVTRVVNNVCQDESENYKEIIYNYIYSRIFIPNSPCLVNAGSITNGMFACFVAGPSEDNLEVHLDTLKDIAQVAKAGGGCGFTGTFIRPENSPVTGSAHGYAYGPCNYILKVNDYMDMMTQAGFRRMALMSTLRSDHPDLDKFIELKQSGDETKGALFNQSIMAENEWMQEAINNPKSKSGEQLKRVVENAWNNGEPGLLFHTTINENTPYKTCGCTIEASNPCGEQLIPEYGSCNLGSINIAHEVFYDADSNFIFSKLYDIAKNTIQFLDNVGIHNKFPNEKFENWYENHRPVGLGLMGYSDALLKLNMTYGKEDALEFLGSVLETMYNGALEKSKELGEKRGIPSHCEKLDRRNSTLLSIAPTGSISFIANCSSSIEPIFAPTFMRTDERGETYSFELPTATLSHFKSAINDNPDKVVSWKEHVDTQLSAQKWVDSGISKCLAKGTIVQTNEGLYRIEEFTNNKQEGTFQDVKGIKTSMGEPIVNHYYNGKTRATTIRLNNGVKITGATESHKIYTPDREWVLLKDLKVGDYILGMLKKSHGKGSELIYWDDIFNTNSNLITTPTTMTTDFAQWLGMITSDGSTVESSGAVILTCANDHVENVYQQLVKRLFNTDVKVIPDNRTDNVRALIITSRNLVRMVENMIGKGAYNKRIPTQILRGSKEEKLAYLSGITLDGYVTPRELVLYEGRSETLAYEIFELCQSFGYYGVNMGEKPIYSPHDGFVYGVRVSGKLSELINPIELHKKVAFPEKRQMVWVGNAQIENTSLPSGDSRYYALRSSKQRKSDICFKGTAERINWDYQGPIYKVTDVYESNEVEMWDIEVDGSHSYITSSILSHNTINFPENATVEEIYDAMVYAWKNKAKGITVYRNNSRLKQVLTTENKKSTSRVHAKRPKEMLCQIHNIKINGDKWTLLVGVLNDKPYELFALKYPRPIKSKVGKIVKVKAKVYNLICDTETIEDITAYNTDEEGALSRLISLYLRSELPLFFLTDQLSKSQTSIVSFSKAVNRVLAKYTNETNLKCQECGSKNLVSESSCLKCLDCGASLCG